MFHFSRTVPVLALKVPTLKEVPQSWATKTVGQYGVVDPSNPLGPLPTPS